MRAEQNGDRKLRYRSLELPACCAEHDRPEVRRRKAAPSRRGSRPRNVPAPPHPPPAPWPPGIPRDSPLRHSPGPGPCPADPRLLRLLSKLPRSAPHRFRARPPMISAPASAVRRPAAGPGARAPPPLQAGSPLARCVPGPAPFLPSCPGLEGTRCPSTKLRGRRPVHGCSRSAGPSRESPWRATDPAGIAPDTSARSCGPVRQPLVRNRLRRRRIGLSPSSLGVLQLLKATCWEPNRRGLCKK